MRRAFFGAATAVLIGACSETEPFSTEDPGRRDPIEGSLALVECADTVTPKSGQVLCGTLDVPESHANPTGGGSRLGLRVFLSRAPSREGRTLPPVVFLAGGPGQSVGLFVALGWLEFFANRFDRNVIFFEQRGDDLSRPALDCKLDTSSADDEVAIRACVDSYAKENVHLEAFNTVESARDLEDLRVAMKRDQIVLWGTSYGSLLAGTFAREHPTSLAGLILEAQVQPDRVYRSFDSEVLFPAKRQDFFNWFNRTCAANKKCQTDHPGIDLATEYAKAIERLKTAPITFIPDRPIATKDDLDNALFASMYFTPNASLMMRALSADNRGEIAAFDARVKVQNVAASEYLGNALRVLKKVRLSTFRIVNCYDLERNWTDDGIASHPIAMSMSTAEEKASFAQLISDDRKSCAALPPPSVDQARLRAVTGGAMPTLFLGAKLDATTPIEWAAEDRVRFPNSQQIVSECQGHGITLGAEQCVPFIMRQFIDQTAGLGGSTLDQSCLARRCSGLETSRDLFIEEWLTPAQ